MHLMANGLVVAEDTLKGRAISINQSAIKPTINLIKRGDYSKDE